MRLRRLDLTAYGKFTGKTLDFGPKPAGQPDFHLVLGRNEAGKSTAFDAYLALMFGMEERTPYKFLHGYKSLEIGGAIEVDGRIIEARRFKADKNSLRGPNNEILPPGLFGASLGGLTRESYRQMFLLDEASLRQGGIEIARSRGELGEMLFAASSGLTEISTRLGDIESEFEAIYKKNGRNTELNKLASDFTNLRNEQRRLETSATQFEKLKRERERAETCHQAAAEALRAFRATTAGRTRLINAFAHLSRLREEEAGLAAIPAHPAPPPGWRAEADGLLEREAGLASALQEKNAVLEKQERAIAALPPELRAPPEKREAGDEHDPFPDLLARLDQDAREKALSQRDDEIADISAKLARISVTPFKGDDAALRDLNAPDRAVAQRLATEALETARALAEAERLAAEAMRKAGLEAEKVKDIVASERLIDEAELATLAETREALWQAHRVALDAASADTYQQAAEAERAALRANLDAAASFGHLKSVSRSAREARLDADAAAETLNHARARHAAAHAAILALLRACALPDAMEPDALPLWLDRRRDRLDLIARAEDAARARDATLTALREETASLAQELAAMGMIVPQQPTRTMLKRLARDGSTRSAEKRAQRGEALRHARALQAGRAETIEAIAGLQRDEATLAARRDQMFAFYGVSDTAALRKAIADGEAAEHQRVMISKTRSALLSALGVAEMAAAEALFAGQSQAALEAEAKTDAEAEQRLQEEEHDAAIAAHDARKALEAIGSEGEGARIAQVRAAKKLEIEEAAERYARLKLGALAVENALARYRDAHRSAMLADAARRFRHITGGSFTDLRTQPEGRSEKLVAIRDNGTLEDGAMSTGTRAQLFLALRLAGYAEYVKDRPALPFIADDIMETFDNPRSAATFEMLAEIAGLGQVIYLSHHDHLAEIARDVVGPDINVIRLD